MAETAYVPRLRAQFDKEIRGKLVEDFPASIADLEEATPVLKKFPGWSEHIDQCLSWDELPLRAREYVQFIEAYTETPVSIISVGSDRQQTIIRESPWIRS